MSAPAERPVALLASRSLNIAHRHVINDFGWQPIAPQRYLTPDGEEVRVVADRSCGFIGYPQGTPVYLLPCWSYRDDWRQIDERIQAGRLVRKPLPKPIIR
ncbi:hypothetical protein [Pseudoroseomonas ludipueritiae]|uniref:Uncharacterized protein n=1 Tax=Pseudoroseomonas ludipueritiae TaxID=198093 RepID=A0ABR7R7M4_9PROT|nr:hypothetical protein [Pseudoroseomonas ludipueritiae]MBC9177804.1 hypothetical protein [Pseudoroseomonas ludipueritiae]MCG7363148.1 hypothetical protein [Roseomonas sp. ACRSG]